MIRNLTTIFIVVALFASACSRDSKPQPPDIAFGQQECDQCSMIISDDRFAAALVLQDGGRFRSVAFDDIGCLLQHEQDHPDALIAARFIRDMQGARWLDATTAAFLRSQALHTPMASGIGALSTPQAAKALLTTYPGEVLDWTTLQRSAAPGQSTNHSVSQGS